MHKFNTSDLERLYSLLGQLDEAASTADSFSFTRMESGGLRTLDKEETLDKLDALADSLEASAGIMRRCVHRMEQADDDHGRST